MDEATRTQIADLIAANNAMAARLKTVEDDAFAARNAGPPLTAVDIGIAVASAMPHRTSDHSRDLDKFPEWSSEETGANYLHVSDFIKNLDARWNLKGTPDTPLRVQLLVEKLRGKALTDFKGFTNAAGNVGDRDTTTWTEFSSWALKTLAPDVLVESEKIEALYEKLEQKGSAEKFADAYKGVVARIRLNSECAKLHTEASLIKTFVRKLKPGVRVLMLDKVFVSLEDAYSEAIRRDAIVFEAAKAPTPTKPPPRGGSGSPSPFYGSRAGTPVPSLHGPPAHIAALLASLGYNPDGSQVSGDSSAPATDRSGASTPTNLGAVIKDHSVPAGAPIPKMTPEIKRWCWDHNACYRCREKNMAKTHVNGHCPRFGAANLTPTRRVNAIEEEGQGNEGALG